MAHGVLALKSILHLISIDAVRSKLPPAPQIQTLHFFRTLRVNFQNFSRPTLNIRTLDGHKKIKC